MSLQTSAQALQLLLWLSTISCQLWVVLLQNGNCGSVARKVLECSGSLLQWFASHWCFVWSHAWYSANQSTLIMKVTTLMRLELTIMRKKINSFSKTKAQMLVWKSLKLFLMLRDVLEEEDTEIPSVTSLSGKWLKPLNLFLEQFLAQLHTCVYGLSHLLMVSLEKSLFRSSSNSCLLCKPHQDISRKCLMLLSSSTCLLHASALWLLLWEFSWVWMPLKSYFTLSVSIGSNSWNNSSMVKVIHTFHSHSRLSLMQKCSVLTEHHNQNDFKSTKMKS